MTAHLRRVVLESPFAGQGRTQKQRLAARSRNERYARAALYDCLIRGEAPIASHLLHTQVLDDDVPAHRRMGIDAVLAWTPVADLSVFYVDLGWSSGMSKARDRCVALRFPFEERTLPLELWVKFGIGEPQSTKASPWAVGFAIACGLFAACTIGWAVLYG